MWVIFLNEKQYFLYFFLKWSKFYFDFSLIFVLLPFLGAFIYLDAVLFLYSFIKDKLICVLQDMLPGLVLKLKFCLLKKLPVSLIFREDKQLVFYLIQYLFWMWPSVNTFANPWDSSVLAESTLFLPKELYFKKNKKLKRHQHVNWSAHAQPCCGDINKPACVSDRSRQMNNTHTHRAALAHCLPKKPDDQTLAGCPEGQQRKNQKIMLH